MKLVLKRLLSKKLGEKIQSNESSIYRYFENKHKLLLYLSSWYWSWIEYNLVFATHNISDPVEKLTIGIKIITQNIVDDISTPHIDESVLNRIIISDFSKTLLTKDVDEENKEGFFAVYKRLINRLIDMITLVNPTYPYAKKFSIVSSSRFFTSALFKRPFYNYHKFIRSGLFV